MKKRPKKLNAYRGPFGAPTKIEKFPWSRKAIYGSGGVQIRVQKYSRLHFEVGNRSGGIQMGTQLANLAVFGLYDRGVKKSILGSKIDLPT